MIAIFILLAFLPSFAWLVFFLYEDSHPEPKSLITKVFAGGFAGAALALAAQILLNRWGIPELSQFANHSFTLPLALTAFLTAIIFGGTEEVAKFIPTYLIVRRNQFFDEPIDAMVYMIVASLGFAFVENAAIIAFSPLQGGLNDALGMVILRFVGATLLHALTSGVVGYFWARAMAHWQTAKGVKGAHPEFIAGREPVHARIFIGGLLLASLLHGIFNYLIIVSREVLIYPTVFLIIIAFFVFWDFELLKSNTNIQMDANNTN